jgi:hypothetical protein
MLRLVPMAGHDNVAHEDRSGQAIRPIGLRTPQSACRNKGVGAHRRRWALSFEAVRRDSASGVAPSSGAADTSRSNGES